MKKKMDKFSLATGIYYEEVEEDMSPQISGFAIHPGLFNEVVEIEESELENVQKSLEGSQLRYDHGDSVLKVIGKIRQAFKTFDENAGKEAVKYYAEVMPDDDDAQKVLKRVKGGYVNASSIGFQHESICSKCGEDFHTCEHFFDEAHIIAKNVSVFELSVVTMGADGDASAQAAMNKDFKEKFIEQFRFKANKEEPENKGGNIMAEEQKPLDVSKLIEQVNAAEKEKLQKEQELAALQKEIKKLKNIEEELDQIKNDTSKDDELEKAQDELKKAQDALKKVDEAKHKAQVESFIALKVQKGLIKESEKEAEIVEFEAKAPETIEALRAQIEVLPNIEVPKNPGKIPKISGFSKEELEKMSKKEFAQRMAHTIFRYDRVFTEDGYIEGRSYVGFKK